MNRLKYFLKVQFNESMMETSCWQKIGFFNIGNQVGRGGHVVNKLEQDKVVLICSIENLRHYLGKS